MHQFQRVTAFFLLIIFGANFLHSVLWHDWRLPPPRHDHLILGSIYPGWEHHHHGELAHAERYPSAQNKPASPLDRAHSQVISLYRPPVGDEVIFSLVVQLLWLAEWLILPERSPLFWPLDLAILFLSGAFLAPPDKPPSPLAFRSLQ